MLHVCSKIHSDFGSHSHECKRHVAMSKSILKLCVKKVSLWKNTNFFLKKNLNVCIYFSVNLLPSHHYPGTVRSPPISHISHISLTSHIASLSTLCCVKLETLKLIIYRHPCAFQCVLPNLIFSFLWGSFSFFGRVMNYGLISFSVKQQQHFVPKIYFLNTWINLRILVSLKI